MCRIFKNIFFSWVIFASFTANAQNADIDMLRQINHNRPQRLDNTFIGFSHSAAPMSIAIPLSVLGYGFKYKDEEIKKQGYEMSASILLSTLVSTSLKHTVQRTRPFDKYPFIEQVINVNSPSFPSGHTTSAFATATALSLNYKKWYVVASSYTWACFVAYSRMDLGVHYPTDVLAGALIGAGSAFLCHKGVQWLSKRKEKIKHTP